MHKLGIQQPHQALYGCFNAFCPIHVPPQAADVISCHKVNIKIAKIPHLIGRKCFMSTFCTPDSTGQLVIMVKSKRFR
eukprot:4639108-Amphidinium_carterae.1